MGIFGAANYLKFSSEYLTQKLGYRFSSGKAERWRHQTAVGGVYQRNFKTNWINNTEVQGYYSFAPNLRLDRSNCKGTCDFLQRRIAGSQAGGGLFGATFIPWKSALLQLRVNYDHVLYERKHQRELHVSGFGGTANLFQKLGCYADFALKTEIRRPFNYFEGLINWHATKKWSGFTIGLFASHTGGRSHLPNNNTAGIQISYLMGLKEVSKDSGDSKKICLHSGTPFHSALTSWVSIPAVYLPEVLAIADQKRSRNACCTAPTSFPVPNQPILVPIIGPSGGTFDASPYFSDPTGTHPLTYALVNPPIGFSIDSSTGVITVENGTPPVETLVLVTATNACGTTSQSINLIPD